MEQTTIQQQAMIYLSGRRGCTVRDGFQSYHTLNFNDYVNEHRKPFFDLLALNDDILKAGAATRYEIRENVHVVLIPVVGGVTIQIDEAGPSFIEAGESLRLGLTKGSVLKVANPYKEAVNFLFLQFSMESAVPQFIKEGFDIDQSKDSLTRIFSSPSGYIGKFSGRADAVFKPKETSRGVFAYVIEGAFEFQNRLLEARDGLSLLHPEEIEFEALSSGAILLLIEV